MDYEIIVLTNMLIGILFALSLNVITGFCGQVSLGHAAFMGIGAYTSGMMTKAGLPFLLTFIPSMLLAAIAGLIVGLASLRVRHDFLAITTMGVVFLFTGIVRKQEFLGGEIGISGIPPPEFGRIGLMITSLICVLIFLLIILQIRRSWVGFSFSSISQDEDTARIMGINVPKFKLFAFIIGTAGAGLSGALYAHQVRYIGPDSFGFVESISVLAMVIIGGIGSIWGVIISAAILSVIPQFFQVIDDYKLLVYGLLLFVVMRFAPDGIGGILNKINISKNKK